MEDNKNIEINVEESEVVEDVLMSVQEQFDAESEFVESLFEVEDDFYIEPDEETIKRESAIFAELRKKKKLAA